MTNWDNCYDCEDIQTSNTYCRGTDSYTNSLTTVPDDLCSPPAPLSSRYNPDSPNNPDILNSPSNPYLMIYVALLFINIIILLHIYIYVYMSRLCMNTSIGCVVTDYDTALHDIARDLYNTYNAIEKAEFLRSMVPRVCGPETMVLLPPCDDEESEGSESECIYDPDGSLTEASIQYWNCTLMTGIPGFVLFLISFLIAIGFKCLCDCKKKYSWLKMSPTAASIKFLMSYVYIGIFSLAIMAMASLGVFFNGEVSRSIDDENYGITGIIVELMDTSVATADGITTPVEGILNLTLNGTDYGIAIATLDNAISTLEYGLDDANTQFDTLNSLLSDNAEMVFTGYGDATYTASDLTLSCTFCVATDASLVSSELTHMENNFSEIGGVLLLYQASVVELDQALNLGIDGQFGLIYNSSKGLKTYLTEAEPALDQYMDRLASFEIYRYYGTIGIFGFVFIATVFTVLGLGTKGWSCFDNACGIYMGLAPLIFLLFAVHLPFALIFGDSCKLMSDGETDPTGTLYWEEEIGLLMSACLANVSLTPLFNLTTALDYLNHDLPLALESQDYIITTQIDALETTISGLSLSDLGWDLETDFYDIASSTRDDLDDGLSDLNVIYQAGCDNGGTEYSGYPVGGFTRANLDTLDLANIPDNPSGCDDNLNIRKFKYDLLTLIDAETHVTQLLSDLQTTSAAISTALTSLAAEFDTSCDGDTLGEVAENMTSATNQLTVFKTVAYCGDVGTHYSSFKYSFCDTLATAVSYISLALLLCGLFALLSLPILQRLVSALDVSRVGVESSNAETVIEIEIGTRREGGSSRNGPKRSKTKNSKKKKKRKR